MTLHTDEIELPAYGGSRPELIRMELLTLKLTGEGMSTEAIGTALGLCHHEVEQLLVDAQGKLEAQNRLHAISIAASRKLIGFLPWSSPSLG